MDGIHDMGGMHGFGPVQIDDEASFFADWQRRVFAANLALAMQTGGNIDRLRYLVECIPPAEYLSASYFERWLASIEASAGENGILSEQQIADIQAGIVPEVEPDEVDAVPPEVTAMMVNAPDTAAQFDMSGSGSFKVGDPVRARSLRTAGHCRLPRYVRGCRGVVVRDNGNQHLPDTRAATGEVELQRLYTVSFTARELWGADTPDTVCLELWESYLEPA